MRLKHVNALSVLRTEVVIAGSVDHSPVLRLKSSSSCDQLNQHDPTLACASGHWARPFSQRGHTNDLARVGCEQELS